MVKNTSFIDNTATSVVNGINSYNSEVTLVLVNVSYSKIGSNSNNVLESGFIF